MPLIRRFGTVGNQGVVTGMQGFGVPPAALTAGLVGAEHMPNGGMFASGAKSSIVAASMEDDNTVCCEVTIKAAGAAPNEQRSVAPMTTCFGMADAPDQPPLAWISTRRFSPAFGSSVLSNWLSPLPIAFSREAATPFSVR